MALVVVERVLEQPMSKQQIQAAMAEDSWCYEANNVRHVESYVSADGKRVLCVFDGPDVESVRRSAKSGRVPFFAVWAAERFVP